MEDLAILTENNSFQSVGKALEKKCTEHFQIEDFLQYCVQLLFFEKTYLPRTVSQNVIDDSTYVAEHILKDKYYISNIAFDDVIEDNCQKSNELISAVSDTLKTDLASDISRNKLIAEFKNSKRDDMVALPKDVTEILKDTIEALNKKDRKRLEKYLPFSNYENDSCFFKILNADNGKVIDELFKISNEHEWNGAMAFGLIKKIRYLTNRNLAEMNDQIFLSSINRSREDAKRIIQLNNNSKTYSSRKRFNLSIPGIIHELVRKSNGDPEKILRLTYDLREKCKPAREFLSKKIEGDSDKNQLAEILREIEIKYLNQKRKIPIKGVLKTAITAGSIVLAVDNIGKIFQDGIFTLDEIKYFTPALAAILASAELVKEIDVKRKLSICYQAFFTEINDNNTIWDTSYGKELEKNCMKDL